MPELSWAEAIKKVLSSSATPLGSREIANRIISEGLRRNLGKTPDATVRGEVSKSINKDKSSSPFIRVGKRIALRTDASEKMIWAEESTPEATESGESEEQYEIVTSFGMFWGKESIEWKKKPKLLGIRASDADDSTATIIDFCKQLGIYLLHESREVICVGRATDTLGKRLYEHTRDRMSTRWDRFSWFGFLPVSEAGVEIGKLPGTYSAEKSIPALEAILIEALEPRQNRKRGDELGKVEYLQKTDPEIDNKKVTAKVAAALSKL